MFPRRLRFCELYASGMSAAQAAVQAGYSAQTASTNVHRLLRDPEVEACIRALMRESREQELLEDQRQLQRIDKIYSELDFILEHGELTEAEYLKATAQMVQILKLRARRLKQVGVHKALKTKTLQAQAMPIAQPEAAEQQNLPQPILNPDLPPSTPQGNSLEPGNPSQPANKFSTRLQASFQKQALLRLQEKSVKKAVKNRHFPGSVPTLAAA